MKRILFAVLVAGIPVVELAHTSAQASASAREQSGEHRRDPAVAAFAREGGQAAAAPKASSAPQTPAATTALQAPSAPVASHAAAFGAAEQTAMVKQYCTSCHSDRGKAGQLTLASFDASKAADPDQLTTTEKMIRKLRAGMMPPASARRPDAAQITALAAALESRIDRAALTNPNPGSRPFQRLNRAEYARAIKDMFDIDIDVAGLLPADTISNGFDNVADAQAFSATLMESYLRASAKVTALAIGDKEAAATETNYRVPKTASQLARVDGAPFGTRGGISTPHTFPADGDYVFKVELHSNACGVLFGGPNDGEVVEISVDGERKATMKIDPRMAETTTGLSLKTPQIHVTAGEHRVTAAFIQRFEGPVNDLIAPIDHTLADTQIGVAVGITTLPHVKDFSIVGPYNVTGISDTASRRKIFTCRPTSAADEAACAGRIIRNIATQAFRGPVSDRDFTSLMKFYSDSRKEGDFEYAIGGAIEAVLASPQFLFRLESTPGALRAGQSYRIADSELASRLSYFIWGTGPDAELSKLAASGRLSAPAVYEKQIARLLADPRSAALSTRFARQWLRLGDVEGVLPDAVAYPYFDRTLGDAFVKESELFFDSLVREDRSILDLLTADYSFANERIARHYGIPNVTGNAFRRVSLPPERRGILTQGSVLVLTSVADRTSPVMRGKWVMEVMMGSPPPAPPADVPAFEATKGEVAGKVLTVRERMEVHRANPTCMSCHRVIDPIGLALENFDVTGKYRIKDAGVAVDTKSTLYDGTPIEGAAGLRAALLKHQDVVLLSFTENLMTYALGRRIEGPDMWAVRRVIRDAEKKNLKLSAFVQGVATSPLFTMGRVSDSSSTTAVAAGEKR
jgi:mono/diheme cytochrome c family protein